MGSAASFYRVTVLTEPLLKWSVILNDPATALTFLHFKKVLCQCQKCYLE